MSWPDPLSLAVFQAIVVFVVVCFVVGLIYTAKPENQVKIGVLASLGAVAWLGLTGGIVASGVFDVPEPFPRVGPYAITSLVMACVIAFSPIGRRLATGVPIAALVAFHGFRLPLELVLHSWADQGTVPADISYLGQNFDIVVGVAAIVLAPFARRAFWAVLIFDVVGLLMLANIVRIVLRTTLGSPFYVAQDQPPLELAIHLPMTWIVSVCVMGAIAGHLVIARWLWTEWRPRAAGSATGPAPPG